MTMNPRLMRPQATGSLPGEGEPATFLVSSPLYNYWLSVKSTTGYFRVDWTSTSSVVYGTGTPATLLTATRETYTEPMDYSVSIYPCDAAGTAGGALTHLEWSGYGITSFTLNGLGSLEHLAITSGGSDNMVSLFLGGLTKLKYVALTGLYIFLDSVDLSGCTALETVVVAESNALSSLHMPNSAKLKTLNCYNCDLTNLDLSGKAALENVDCSFNGNLASLTVAGCTSLHTLNAASCNLSSLNVSGLTALSILDVNANASLASLAAAGFVPGGGVAPTYHGHSGISVGANIANCSLAAAALNQFYTDLATGSGVILVTGNPGASSDNPSIATAKGYTVYGS